MLRIIPVFLVILGLLLPEAHAQTTTKSRTTKAAAETAESTPAPRKLSFFERLFGRRRKPTPAPATPTPAPKAVTKSRKPRATSSKPAAGRSTAARTTAARTTAARTKTPDTTPDTTPDAPAEKPAPAPAPEPAAEKPAPKPAARKTSGKPANPAKTVPMEPGGVDQDELDRQKYDAAKAKAVEDPEVAALKKKADEAISDDEANKAQRAYNKALFAKMRKVEPAIRERIDRMEAAMMKRLNDQPGAR